MKEDYGIRKATFPTEGFIAPSSFAVAKPTLSDNSLKHQ